MDAQRNFVAAVIVSNGVRRGQPKKSKPCPAGGAGADGIRPAQALARK
jgi:hypothetical protein